METPSIVGHSCGGEWPQRSDSGDDIGGGTGLAPPRGSPPRAASLSSTAGRTMSRVISRLNFPPASLVTWDSIREEAEAMIARDEFMIDAVTEKILKHETFADAIVESLALAFQSSTIPAAQWSKLLGSVYEEGVVYEESDMLSVEKMGLLDLGAVRERDPASNGLVNPFLFFKGYKSIQAHRIAHVLWKRGRRDAARAIQSRCSEVWAVDVHPAASNN